MLRGGETENWKYTENSKLEMRHWKMKIVYYTLKKKFHKVQTKHEIPISKNVTVSYISTHAAPRGRSRFFRN